MTKKKQESVGGEMVDRLRRFTEKLDAIDNVSDLPEVLTVRRVKLNLRPQDFSGEEVKQIRNQLRVSQAVFAEFLGVSVRSLQDWEQGQSVVSGPTCRLLEEISRDFPSWSKRLRELAEVTA
ncbi:helix-turn-helix domain-containing protein [Novipirellula caenicola]|uniref:HTH cro/C1-type domain-containing protein n=1 Tax=Novipirellula caenicola TaxID=1536901 RepID=A0ABP9VTD0_9BACT